MVREPADQSARAFPRKRTLADRTPQDRLGCAQRAPGPLGVVRLEGGADPLDGALGPGAEVAIARPALDRLTGSLACRFVGSHPVLPTSPKIQNSQGRRVNIPVPLAIRPPSESGLSVVQAVWKSADTENRSPQAAGGGHVSATGTGLAMLAVLGLWVTGLAVPSSGAETDGRFEMAAPAEGSSPVAPTPRSRFTDPIERAWFAPAFTLDERVSRTRRASLALGVRSLDGAARAVLLRTELGDPLKRSAAALTLAPDLPAAHIERARALWLHGDSPLAALRAIGGALSAVPRHPEASIWLGGSVLFVLAVALVAGGLLYVAAAAALALPRVVHDLGHLSPRSIPGFARGALLASLLLLPLLFGQGILGIAIALFAVGAVYGGFGQRISLGLAAAMVIAGAYPVAQLACTALNVFSGDPVVEAAMAATGGLALDQDRIRLEEAKADDLLAARALAMRARREGDLAQADAHYQALVRVLPEDAGILNNAAGVRLRLGQVESAIELYEAAARLSGSPTVLFNLSQAYGRAFQMEDLARTLARAQEADGEIVAHLTALQSSATRSFVVDLPLSVSLLWRRALTAEGGREIAAELRGKIAPGALGRDWWVAALAFGVVAVCATVLGASLRASQLCGRCGRRLCPRCDPETDGHLLCDACVRLFHHPGNTDPSLRQARINQLRDRERRLDQLTWAASVFLPGVAGLLAARPMRGLFGALFFAVAASSIFWREGVAPDPLVAGATAPIVFIGTAAVALGAYAIVVATSLATRREV